MHRGLLQQRHAVWAFCTPPIAAPRMLSYLLVPKKEKTTLVVSKKERVPLLLHGWLPCWRGPKMKTITPPPKVPKVKPRTTKDKWHKDREM
jgi:hypothetical protein